MVELDSTHASSGNNRPDQIESMLIHLQTARIAFVSAVMQFRFAPVKEHKRLTRRATIAFFRLQRSTQAAAKLLDEPVKLNRKEETSISHNLDD